MSREAFERWYAEAQREPNVRRYADGNGVYTHLAMQSAWLGWQAAQAQAVDGEAVELPEIYEQYRTWPEDIKRKLSLHDLRRMTGWKLHCCNPFQTVNQQLLDDIVNLLIAARGAIKLGSDVNATNYISAAIAAAQEGE